MHLFRVYSACLFVLEITIGGGRESGLDPLIHDVDKSMETLANFATSRRSDKLSDRAWTTWDGKCLSQLGWYHVVLACGIRR